MLLGNWGPKGPMWPENGPSRAMCFNHEEIWTLTSPVQLCLLSVAQIYLQPFSFASASSLLPSLPHCINRKQSHYLIFLGKHSSVFYFFIGCALTSKGVELLVSPEELFQMSKESIYKSQAADMLMVFFWGILIVGVVRNSSFYFVLTASGLIQGCDTNCSQLKPDTLG